MDGELEIERVCTLSQKGTILEHRSTKLFQVLVKLYKKEIDFIILNNHYYIYYEIYFYNISN